MPAAPPDVGNRRISWRSCRTPLESWSQALLAKKSASESVSAYGMQTARLRFPFPPEIPYTQRRHEATLLGSLEVVIAPWKAPSSPPRILPYLLQVPLGRLPLLPVEVLKKHPRIMAPI